MLTIISFDSRPVTYNVGIPQQISYRGIFPHFNDLSWTHNVERKFESSLSVKNWYS